MKAIITLIFVLVLGVTAQAKSENVEINPVVKFEQLTEKVSQEVKVENNDALARLYRRTNSRVKKELSFSTKRTRAKLA